MNKIDQKRENEKRILKVMIDIYQRKHPQESDALFWKIYAFLPSTSYNQTWMAFT